MFTYFLIWVKYEFYLGNITNGFSLLGPIERKDKTTGGQCLTKKFLDAI